MANPLSIFGAVAATSSLLASASKSAKGLYNSISGYRGYPDTVQSLKTEVYGVMIVLQRIQKMSLDGNVLAELEPILKACYVACSGLQQAIIKCTERNGGRQPSFQDWVKMEFLGGTISDLKETLKGYKDTIAIIITSINNNLGQMTLCQLADYQREIADTNARLAEQLHRVNRPPAKRQADQESIKEVEDAILRCMEACRKAGSTIERVRQESFEASTRTGTEQSVTARRIWQMTDEDLHYVRKYLFGRELKLLEMKKRESQERHWEGD
ncbi:hypothetical protein AnigIFM63604_000827 [Aspergillus niger]|uniref:Azaphilone pigments biosynthesis cluster protein L N-terminal domain-containing protein n=2 Tax=Aspergillus TaxID=5052 RepID=A0A370PH58_ASPPH|nr:hypothetical protein M752DRAFT_303087 [Aspergillus phoenicis ATCC 13157]GLA26393.1 hypothetical protein AnigIFM63326_003546 [Aspergillus niger]GLA54681.1 hypothetical protein AnigIFM63604_000827 [Aspergillus niger]